MRIRYELIVIGAGGTGTYFLKEISRFLQGERKNMFCGFHIFDGDTVEEKNLSRQCFTTDDIGRNKAAVMAEVLGEAFDIAYKAHGCYLLTEKQLSDCVTKDSYDTRIIPIVVGCVDNHACRLVMEKFFEERESVILFDSGNEFSSGEVVYSYKMDGKIFGPVRSFYFPDVKKGDLRNREEVSCEELNNVAPQHIFTNMQAGNLLCAGVANLLSEKITAGFVYYNALNYESGFVSFKNMNEAEKTSAS